VPIIGSNTVTYSNYRHVTVRRVGYARVQPPLLRGHDSIYRINILLTYDRKFSFANFRK